MLKLVLLFAFALYLPSQVTAQELNFDELKLNRTIQVCVHYLDGYLCLSRKQHVALENLLKQNFKPELHDEAAALLYGAVEPQAIIECFRQSDLTGVLSEDQLQQFGSIGKHRLTFREQRIYLSSEIERDPIRNTLDRAVLLEVQRLRELLNLTEGQTRKLRVAAKHSANLIAEERQNLRPRMAGNRAVFDRCDWWLPVAILGPAFRIQELDFWNSTLETVLTKKQHSQLLEEQVERSIVFDEVSSHSLVVSVLEGDITVFNKDEYRKFTKLFEQAIRNSRKSGVVRRNGSVVFEELKILCNIDKELIVPILSEENWSRLEAYILQLHNNNLVGAIPDQP